MISTRTMPILQSIIMSERRMAETMHACGTGEEAMPFACFLPVIVDANEQTDRHKLLRRIIRTGDDKYRMDLLQAPLDWSRE